MNLTGANPPPNYFQGGYSPRSPCGSAAPASHNVIFKTQTSDLIEIIIELCNLSQEELPIHRDNRLLSQRRTASIVVVKLLSIFIIHTIEFVWYVDITKFAKFDNDFY